MLVGLYLFAIVAANLAVAAWGPPALALTAWVLIPFDMTSKDALQDRWRGDRLLLRMGALVLTGSILSTLLNLGAGRVALASFVAFACSSTLDVVVYEWGAGLPRLAKVNLSNAAAALTDSLLFQIVAFGSFDLTVFGSQAAAKFVGGAIWSLLLGATIWRVTRQR